MGELKKLPNGYRQLVKEAKVSIQSLITHLNNVTNGLNVSAKIEGLAMHTAVTGEYYDKDCMHVDFDANYKTICIGAYVDIKPNGRMVLGKTCTVFLNKNDKSGNENYIDAYKW